MVERFQMVKDVEPYKTIISEVMKNETEADVVINNKYLLDLFNNLSDTDKVELIRSVYKCNISSEINSIEDVNGVEMVKLKIWFIKTTALIVLFIVVFFISSSILLSDDIVEKPGKLNEIQQIYNAIFSNK